MVEIDTVANNLVEKRTSLNGETQSSLRANDVAPLHGSEAALLRSNDVAPSRGGDVAPTKNGDAASVAADDKALLGVLLNCPHCAKPYQILNPQEGMVYQCQQCQTQFLIRKEATGKFQALKWSEEQILKILFDVPGENRQSQLFRAWRNAFDNLSDVKAHEQFVFLCRQKNSLNLAKEKYKQLSLYLNWDGLPEYLKVILEPNRVKLSPMAERMPWIVLGIAALLILLGSVLQGHRNMIGAGVLVGVIDFLIYRKRFKLTLNN